LQILLAIKIKILKQPTDFFVENPPRQPKFEIADYVESEGILVPTRFANLKEALESGKEFIIRSEHPDEYNGASGLLESYTVNQSKMDRRKEICAEKGREINWEKIYNFDENETYIAELMIIQQMDELSQTEIENLLKKLSKIRIENYCSLLNLNIKEFENKISYSYWEKLDGYNRTIIADTAIEGRYHIFTHGERFRNYFIYENGMSIFNGKTPLLTELNDKILETIEFYEKIKCLPKFNKNHCPIVEFQSVDGKDYFLQYHRTRDRQYSNFELTRPLEEGEFKAHFVRGVTDEKGETLNTSMYYPEDIFNIGEEDASFDFNPNDIFSEIMNRKRICFFSLKSLHRMAMECSIGHFDKSKIFNPKLYVAINEENIPKGLIKKLLDETDDKREPAKVTIRVISDGRKAYVKFLI